MLSTLSSSSSHSLALTVSLALSARFSPAQKPVLSVLLVHTSAAPQSSPTLRGVLLRVPSASVCTLWQWPVCFLCATGCACIVTGELHPSLPPKERGIIVWEGKPLVMPMNITFGCSPHFHLDSPLSLSTIAAMRACAYMPRGLRSACHSPSWREICENVTILKT